MMIFQVLFFARKSFSIRREDNVFVNFLFDLIPLLKLSKNMMYPNFYVLLKVTVAVTLCEYKRLGSALKQLSNYLAVHIFHQRCLIWSYIRFFLNQNIPRSLTNLSAMVS